ncbi:RNA-binding S4 domain-containing protein [Duganella callida]|uniref:RNA-binding S4 domain-containing protein n=1 Tax=Duganella callida TaxID=2561932 RepID=A0A4Y9SVH9_9BURK|nr:RNA-binding S4 domain-containing protein [Duganella callida]TFW30438.1 RNA-binding S4 domain-containing protein [Duganella callida]
MSDAVRLDKWLWAARFFKTRSLACDAVDRGRVTVNGDRAKPARNVKVGDVLEIDNGSDKWEVDVMNLSDVRGPATVARNLYEETDVSVARRAAVAENRRLFPEPSAHLKGRPTKRDRRHLDNL